MDPKRRPGSGRLNLGKSIVIEEDCWIGGGVIILPGRTIRQGGTVGAGSVVTQVCSYDFLTLISLSTWKKSIGMLPGTYQP